MSLLMEALRKAEQAKQKAAEAAVGTAHHDGDGSGLPIGATPGAGETGPGERGETEPSVGENVTDASVMSPDAQLGLEEQEEEIVLTPLVVDSSAELANSEGEKVSITDRKKGESNGLTLEKSPVPDQGLMVEVGMQDVMVVDTPPQSPEADAGLAPDTSMDKDANPSVPLVDAIPVDTPAEHPEAESTPAAKATQSVPEREASTESVEKESIPPAIVSAESSRQAARTVFAAKKEYQLQGRNRRLRVLGGVGGLLGVGLAAFFFYVYRSMTLPVVSTPVVVAEKNITSVDSASTAASTSGADVAGGEINKEIVSSPPDSPPVSSAPPLSKETPLSVSPPVAASPQGTPLSPGAAPLTSVTTQSAPASLPANQGAPSLPANETAGELPREVASAPDSLLPENPAPAPIVITHRAAQPQTSPLLTSAYNAYQKGEFPLARNMYQQVLQADPKNRGALLGLASIALQGRETSVAREFYLRLLDQDPGDPLARAGMLAIAPTGDLAQQESELKLLLKQYPQSAPLFFSLGNVYAAGQRWSEAQQAYFDALEQAKNTTATGGSHASSVSGKSDTLSGVANVPPDYPFNLAISLEHLGQMKPAVKYYQEALQLSAGQPAGFDPETLRTRLQTLVSGATP
jgi:hypothetical protein